LCTSQSPRPLCSAHPLCEDVRPGGRTGSGRALASSAPDRRPHPRRCRRSL